MGGIEAGTFLLPQRPHLCWALCLAQDAGQLLFPVPGVLRGTRCWVSSTQPQSTEALKVWADEKKRRKRTVHKYLQTVFETQSDVAKLCSRQLCWTPHLIFHCLLQCNDSYPQEQSCPGDPVCVTGDEQKREKSRLLLSASLLLFCFSLTFFSGKDLSALLSQHPGQLFPPELEKAGVQGLEQAAMKSRRKRKRGKEKCTPTATKLGST